MGYTTEFRGEFTLNRTLQPKIKEFLAKFNNTRRMGRKLDSSYGIEGEFYVDGGGVCGQGHEESIVDCNVPPSTQPGLWCQWTPNEEGTAIVWDEGEKFYGYTAWIVYLVEKVLKPNGYVLNGAVEWRGEDFDDNGTITIRDNAVFINDNEESVSPKGEFKTSAVILFNEGVEIQHIEVTEEETLVDDVIERMKVDINAEDWTAIAELLSFVPKENLQGYLPE